MKDPGETSKYEKTPEAEDETSKVETKRALKGYDKKTKSSIGDLSLELAKVHVSYCMLELAIFVSCFSMYHSYLFLFKNFDILDTGRDSEEAQDTRQVKR